MPSQAQLLAWITRHLRTVETSERLPSHHETYVYWAMIIVTTRRLARKRGLPSQILFEPRNYLTQLLTDKSYPRRLPLWLHRPLRERRTHEGVPAPSQCRLSYPGTSNHRVGAQFSAPGRGALADFL